MNSQVANILKFYGLAIQLKDVIRAGWKLWGIERERLESVAEHVFGTQMLAIAIWSEYQYEIDIQKVCFMLALHELEEVVIGDYTPHDHITAEEKARLGHEAVHSILDGLLKQSEIESIILEFDARETPEAKFAFQCDKLEWNLQAYLYDHEGCIDSTKQSDNPLFQDEKYRELQQQGLSWSEIVRGFDRERNKNNYDDNFLAIIDSVSSLDKS